MARPGAAVEEVGSKAKFFFSPWWGKLVFVVFSLMVGGDHLKKAHGVGKKVVQKEMKSQIQRKTN